MRVLIDTNIVISAMLSPRGRIAALLRSMMLRHTICIASFSLEEIEKVVRRKFPWELAAVDTFLTELTYEIIRTPDVMPELPDIRDPNDRPILASAIVADVDFLLTGDKDFADVEIERPKILTPAQFSEKHL